MKRKYVDFYLGLFVLAGLVAIGYMIIKFGGISTKNRYDITVLFDSVEVLIREAPVYYAGVECGKVTRIVQWGAPVEERPHIPINKVKVVMSLDRGTMLHSKDQIKIVPISLLGEKAVEITPGDVNAPLVPKDGSAVMSGTTLGLADALKPVLGPFAEPKFQQDIRDTFSSFAAVMKNLEEWTGEKFRSPVQETVGELNKAVGDFRVVLADFSDAVRKITGAGQEAQRLLTENREQIRVLLGSLDETLKSFDRVVDNLYPVVADVKAGRGGLGKIITDPSWYAYLNEVLWAMSEGGILGMKDALEKKRREEKQTRTEVGRVWVR